MPVTKRSTVNDAHRLPTPSRTDDYLADMVQRLSSDVWENNNLVKEQLDQGDKLITAAEDLSDKLDRLADLVESLTEVVKTLDDGMRKATETMVEALAANPDKRIR